MFQLLDFEVTTHITKTTPDPSVPLIQSAIPSGIRQVEFGLVFSRQSHARQTNQEWFDTKKPKVNSLSELKIDFGGISDSFQSVK